MNLSQLASLAASVATVIAALAVVVTAIIYQRQLVAMTRARQLDSLLVILKIVEDIGFRRARYLMLEHSGDKELQGIFVQPYSWDTRRAIDSRLHTLSGGALGIHEVDLALNAFNNVCFLVRQEYAPAEVIDASLKNTLLHAWEAFEPYVKHRRQRTGNIGGPSQYARHIEWVVQNRCL
jgi:hypothetical protein